ncbi:ChaN family lipoprotein [Hyalangium gracile]|uniref:ChaN family lipoprotein n=1 Tax=Hyalangium gracile TaxID=394092 RepID=UPI001CCEA5E4|nr:ChaN family lipoprotein [Hyalangium gracile]
MRPAPLLRLVPLLLLLVGCATAGTREAPTGQAAAAHAWQSPLLRDHPLIGRIWDVSQGRWLEEPALREQLAKARYVLLGERHDNADHHLLQASLVRALAGSGRRPALAFEMLDVEQQATVDAALAREPGNADAIAQAVDWAHSGWPDWALYRPIFAAGLERGLPIVAANLSRAQGKALAMQGTSALPAELVTRLGLDTPLPEDVSRAMRSELFQAHCGAMPETHMEPMVQVQRARDAQMAERLRASDTGDGAILITGAGHARTDRGVPAHLARGAGGATVRSVGFVEVSADKREPGDYVEADGTGRLPFDYVWFTPAAEREDLCAKLRERMKHGAHPPPQK